MYLKRDNANIYYEVSGRGEALVLIHGAITDSAIFERAAKILSADFKVITFDRRGNSRSKAGSINSIEQGFSIDLQADDVRALMDELNIEKAYIAGVSLGAVVAERFFEMYPDRVEHLVMYEAGTLARMMRDDDEYRAWAKKTKEYLDAGKINNALLRFSEHLGPVDMRSPDKSAEVMQREYSNIDYSFQYEIPAMLSYYPDEKFMKKEARRITIAAGERSGDTAYVRESKRLAEMIGRQLIFYPGGHNAPHDVPQEFAISIMGTIKLRDQLG